MKEFTWLAPDTHEDLYRPEGGELIKFTDNDGVAFLTVFSMQGSSCLKCALNSRGCFHYPVDCIDGHYELVDTLLEDL